MIGAATPAQHRLPAGGADRTGPMFIGAGLALPLVAVLADGIESSGPSWGGVGALIMSVGMVLFSGASFLRDGGWVITPLGIYQLSAAVFAGASPLLMRLSDVQPAPRVMTVLVVVHLGNVAVHWFVHWRTRDMPARVAPTAAGLTFAPGAACPSILLGMALVALGLGATLRDVSLSALPARTAYVGALIVCAPAAVTVLWRRPWRRVMVLLGTLSVGAYVSCFFSGFGRLIVATLVLSIALVANMARPRRWHKPLILAGLIPAMLVGGMAGIGRNPADAADVDIEQVVLQARGLDSVFEPLNTFATVVDLDESNSSLAFPRQRGRTFIDALLLWVPRSMWPSKPVGLGQRLTEVLLPSQLVSGHTMAALSWGEWYVNFGWLGVVASAPVAALVLVLLRRWQHRLLMISRATTRDIVNATSFTVVTAGLADYMWMGSFTYVSRSGIAAAILAVVSSILRVSHGLRRRRYVVGRARLSATDPATCRTARRATSDALG